jgi:hypothetical protein
MTLSLVEGPMNAGDGERARTVRMVVLALTVVLCAIACVAGVPMRWVPIVIGGGLSLLAAVAAT